jgi:NADPH:quinone reductase
MLAAVIANKALTVATVETPTPGAGELLIKVHAAGLNNADRIQIAGFYGAPPGSPSDIPGLELAGTVAAIGPGVYRFAVGDKVMAVVGGGALAEFCVAHERTVMPVPEGIDWAQAGGFPEAFTTAHDALVTQCGLVTGERLCVHGAAGGVGIAGVQIGALLGSSVTATVRSEGLRERVAAFGATVVAPEDFGNHGPFDVVLELVGASNLSENIRALNIGGRITVIGVSATGSKGELDLLALMGKRARIHGSTLRTRPLEQKADAARRVETQLLPHFASGRLQVPIEATFPLADVNGAYARFAEGGKLGKIVVIMP